MTYDVFKKALAHSVQALIQNSPPLDEVVAFSGGVDSLVLLSLVKGVKDVSTITFRLVPPIPWNSPDTIRSARMAEKLGVCHDIIDIDLNEVDLAQLEDFAVSMPFAAHLSSYFTGMFERLRRQGKRVWCGQDLDGLYNYAATFDLWIIHRLLLSDSYARMIEGSTALEGTT